MIWCSEFMKIVMISPKTEGIGGVAQHVSTLIGKLREQGFTIKVVSSENTFIINKSGFRNPSFALFSIPKIFLRKYDIVHGHEAITAIPMLTTRGKHILTIHGIFSKSIEYIHGKFWNKVAKFYEKRFFKHIDTITVVSKSSYKYYKSIGYNPIYIPNAIDLSIIPKNGIREHTRQVVFIGRISKEKGIDILLQAFTKDILKNIDLIVIGNGPLRNNLEKRYTSKNIHFKGFLPRKIALKYLKGSDLFVLPSRIEGLSTSILEAMACKTPIIATNVGGNSELIRNGENGILIKPEDPDTLAFTIRNAFDNYSYMERLAETAYKEVCNKYNWNIVFKKYLEVYGL